MNLRKNITEIDIKGIKQPAWKLSNADEKIRIVIEGLHGKERKPLDY